MKRPVPLAVLGLGHSGRSLGTGLSRQLGTPSSLGQNCSPQSQNQTVPLPPGQII